jgi:hypothetical protein
MHDDCVKYDNMLTGHCAAVRGGRGPGTVGYPRLTRGLRTAKRR